MRWSQFYLFTTREVPADAEVTSHKLMVRTGMIKKTAAGIYSYLPFGWRSLQKLSEIVRRELGKAHCVELHMPAIQPAELWQESGRWQKYGKELLRIDDRHDREFCFGPTHEEVITDIVRRDVRSYRQLPFNMFQIQVKFRDEIRPRFGLMRGREFLMKDAYSFHADAASLDEAYEAMRLAYCRIFEACKLEYSVVEADTGSIGGSSSHEFMVLAGSGESAVVRCPNCGYAANTEKAKTNPAYWHLAPPDVPSGGPTKVPTPGAKSVEEVAKMLGVMPEHVVKTLLYETEKGIFAVAIRGDREVNEVKLGNHLGTERLALANEQQVVAATGAPVGYAGPIGLADDITLLIDDSAAQVHNFVCGANEADAHFVGCNWADVTKHASTPGFDFVLVRGGDPCPRCDGTLEEFRGIEVGHIFKLGTKYSQPMQCNFLDAEGQSHPMVMGCYGLGIGRTVAAAIEQNHDADGIVWPVPLAPFSVLLVALNPDDENVQRTAADLYARLSELRLPGGESVDVLFDDRDERPGVKFKDADLIGIPVRLVVGAKSLADGKVEVSLRRDRQRQLVEPGEATERVAQLLAQ